MVKKIKDRLEDIKTSNDKWLKRDYDKNLKEQQKRNRKISPWSMNGISEQPYAKGLKRFDVCRG